MVKKMSENAGDWCSISRLERSPGVGNANPLQYSCLGNAMDRGAWWATCDHKESDMTERLNSSKVFYLICVHSTTALCRYCCYY